MKIEEEKALVVENLLSFRGNIQQNELNYELNKMGKFIAEQGMKKMDPVMSTTYSI